MVKLLGNVVHKTAVFWQLEKLYESNYFRRDDYVTVPDSEFALSLLQFPKGTISTQWQKAILQSSINDAYLVLFVPRNIFNTENFLFFFFFLIRIDITLNTSDDVIMKLEEGLKTLDRPELVKVEGSLRPKLCDAVVSNIRN